MAGLPPGAAAGPLLVAADPAGRAGCGGPATSTRSWSATSASSTCCSRGCCSRARRSCSISSCSAPTPRRSRARPRRRAAPARCCARSTRSRSPRPTWSSSTRREPRAAAPPAARQGRRRRRSAPGRVVARRRAHAPCRRAPGGPLRVVFFGLFTPLQGADVIAAALAALGRSRRHRGDDDRRRAAARRAPASWPRRMRPSSGSIGSPPAELPALVAAHDVCLGIFGTGAEGAAGGAEQGLSRRGRRLRDRHLRHRAAAPRARRRGACYVAAGRPARAGDGAARPGRRPRRGRPGSGAAARDRALATFGRGTVVEPLRDRLAGRRSTDESHPPLSPMATLRWSVVSRVLDELAPPGARGRLRAGRLRRPDRRPARRDAVRRGRTGRAVVDGRPRAHRAARRRGAARARPTRRRRRAVRSGLRVRGDRALEPTTGALRSWIAHLRPGGTVLVSVPAGPERFGPMDTLVGHYRRYTPDQLDAVLRAAGCAPVDGHGLRLAAGLRPRGGAQPDRGAAARRTGSADRDGGALGDERPAAAAAPARRRRRCGSASRPFAARLQRWRPSLRTGLVGFGRSLTSIERDLSRRASGRSGRPAARSRR